MKIQECRLTYTLILEIPGFVFWYEIYAAPVVRILIPCSNFCQTFRIETLKNIFPVLILHQNV